MTGLSEVQGSPLMGQFQPVGCRGLPVDAGAVGVILGTGPAEEPVEPFGHFEPMLPGEVAALAIEEGEVVGGVALDVQVAVVEVAVAAGAEGDEVVGRGGALL